MYGTSPMSESAVVRTGGDKKENNQKIVPCLWFDSQAEDAAKFYVSIFNNSSIDGVVRYGKEGFEIHQMKEGTVVFVNISLKRIQFLSS